MKQSNYFVRILKDFPKDEVAINAKYLIKAGYIYKNSAGVYSYLPLGLRVIEKINNIIREEMNKLGALELLMPALLDKHYLMQTQRWDVEISFEVKGKKDKQANYNLGWTHEEVLAEIAKKYVNSFKDLPFSAYQIQTKFRNEPRAKAGILRGREFIMKDLYSFHENEKDLFNFYNKVKKAYDNVFKRCGLKTFYTLAGGGDFTLSYTHEFQVEAEVGEDEIIACRNCFYGENIEIKKNKEGEFCPNCQKNKLEKIKAIEVGNIFPLGTKYSKAFNLTYKDKKGQDNLIVMGSYGIGVSRLMGTVVEIYHDERGIIWPENIAPFKVHLLILDFDKSLKKIGEKIYNKLRENNIEVLFDDRNNVSNGEKLVEADWLGIPYRLVISLKTKKDNKIEVKKRKEKNIKFYKLDRLIKNLK